MKENNFAFRLREARLFRGLKQADFKKFGLNDTQISRFESGRGEPSFRNLEKLVKALDVSADFLLGKADDFVELYASKYIFLNKKNKIAIQQFIDELYDEQFSTD